MNHVYLDHNATTALRPEAREAMIAAMDILGNPSSVHKEGREAKAVLEKARADISEATGASNADIVFTSGATEAAALALHGRHIQCAGVEHPCVLAYCDESLTLNNGLITDSGELISRQHANSESGVVQSEALPVYFEDAVQAFGKIPYAFSWRRAQTAAISAHKIGGPKGVGALIMDASLDLDPLISGGGQESSRRAGTENIIGIAGFAAAAQASQRALNAGEWDALEERRNAMEAMLLDAIPELTIVGAEQDRLPNTTAMLVKGWKAETQVMQMDLAGFAISAGSACSSGKVRASKTLLAMGYDEQSAASCVRVSLSPQNTTVELEAFAKTYIEHYKKWRKRAA